jgi:glycosyltransferase involved in cell wall biosynthesis
MMIQYFEIFHRMDLTVVPSLWEDPYPTVVLEAMANGRPVVAYANGGIPELIPPYGGVVVKRKNPILLAKAMEMTMQGTVSFNETSTIELVRGKFLLRS